jgi:hypothetical protein
VVAWAALACRQWPELLTLYAIPNGSYYGKDRIAAAKHANRMRAEGLRPGIPDLCLPVARGGWHSLRIEMKSSAGVLSMEQRQTIAALMMQGNKCVVCRSAEDAIAEIRGYLMAAKD